MQNLNSVALKIIQLRETQNLTQEQLAQKANIPLDELKNIESANPNFHMAEFFKLSDVLKFNHSKIFSDCDKSHKQFSCGRRTCAADTVLAASGLGSPPNFDVLLDCDDLVPRKSSLFQGSLSRDDLPKVFKFDPHFFNGGLHNILLAFLIFGIVRLTNSSQTTLGGHHASKDETISAFEGANTLPTGIGARGSFGDYR